MAAGKKKVMASADAPQTPGPMIARVTYDPGTLTLNWVGPGIGPGTPCHVTLTGSAGPASYPATGTSATIQRDLSSGGPWMVSVSVDGGGSSASVPVVIATTTLSLVQNLGASIAVAWTQATGTTSNAVELSLQGSGQSQTWITTSSPFTIPQSVTGQNWMTTVRGTITSGSAISYGPGASAPVLTTAAVLARVVYSGTDTQLVWAPVPGYAKFWAALTQGSTPPTTKSVNGMSYTFPGALAGTGWQATVSVQSANSISIGPPSPAANVILVAPVMARVAFAAQQLALRWVPIGGQTSYAATVWNGTENFSQMSSTDTTSFPGPFSGTGWQCSVRAQSADGVSLGPPSTVYQPIFAAPTLLTFAYDGATITVTWTNASAPTATDNLLGVATGGSETGFSVGTSGSASVPATLSATLAYTAVIYASNGIVFGPPSAPLVPITAPPQLVYLGNNGTSLVGFWKAPAGVTAPTFNAVLTTNGVPVTRANVVSPLIFGVPLAAATAYAMQVRTIVGAVTGPPNPPASGPYSATQVLSYDAVGRIASIAWNGHQTMAWTYDSAGNLLTQSLTVSAVQTAGEST